VADLRRVPGSGTFIGPISTTRFNLLTGFSFSATRNYVGILPAQRSMQCSIASPIFIIPHEYLTTTADSHNAIAGTQCFSASCRKGGDNKIIPHEFREKKPSPNFSIRLKLHVALIIICEIMMRFLLEILTFDDYFPVSRSKKIFFPVTESGIA
jgi:hypothetical protein